MFPHFQYNLPIFSVDLIASQAGIGAAIVDLSPVNSDPKGSPKGLLKDTVGFSVTKDLRRRTRFIRRCIRDWRIVRM